MKPYPLVLVDDLLRPVRRVAMPRAPRLAAPGGTVHGVARCTNREVSFTTPENFAAVPARPRHGRPRIGAIPQQNQGVRG